jgi:glycosyltransferase involved in cell wall biosynthesis
MKILIQCDQISAAAGGGRFLRGLIAGLRDDPSFASGDAEHQLLLLATQGETENAADDQQLNAKVVRRRFPSRARGGHIEALWSRLLPSADVIYGSFFHVHPHPKAAKVVTIHDTSFLFSEFHHERGRIERKSMVSRSLEIADRVVCSSVSTQICVSEAWPMYAHKTCVAYCGVDLPQKLDSLKLQSRGNSLLAVGTIEPRKNYARICEAYKLLRARRPHDCPMLEIVGRQGWMCEREVDSIRQLEERGLCRWHRNADDADLWSAYKRCAVFTYLPLMEGFGYPPFEAASFCKPMVLSNLSSVGEIWKDCAICADPRNVYEILRGWETALDLSSEHRMALVARQYALLKTFAWPRCCERYVSIWREACA